MTARPLFDRPIAQPTRKPSRRAKHLATPLIPVEPKPTPETWTVQFTAAPGNAPEICRVKRLLKSAWRRYRLKARIVAGPGTIATPGDSTGNQSSKAQRSRETAANEARMARFVRLRDKIQRLVDNLKENG